MTQFSARQISAALAAVLVLSACASEVPASNPRGVGFGGADEFAQQRAARDAQLASPPGVAVPERTIGSETLAVLNATASDIGSPASPSGEPLSAIRTTGTDPSSPRISDEQNFDAVASRESIESDRQRLERNRAAYEVVTPTALPQRTGTGPNVVAFALSTTNARGQQIYERSGFNRDARFKRACAGFPSQDRAQEAFLANGGPERDRAGMDPDGDGFACLWDPSPFRAVRSN